MLRRIPILGDNPVFVLEAGRLWRPRMIALAALGTLAALGIGFGLFIGAVSVGFAAGAFLDSFFFAGAAFPEGLLVGDVWCALTEQGPLLESVGYEGSALDVAFWIVGALSVALSKYVVPAIVVGVAMRWRSGGLDSHTLATLLPPRRAVAGLFWVAALPAMVVAVLLVCLAFPVTAELEPTSRFVHPFEVAALLGSMAVSTPALCLAGAMLPRRRHYAALAAIGAVWVAEPLLGVAWCASMLACGQFAPSLGHYAISAAFAGVRLLLAYLALRLAAKLWRRPPPNT